MEQTFLRTQHLTPIAALVLASAVVAPAGAAETYQLGKGDVTVVCPMTVGGSFEARTAAVTARLDLDPSAPDAVGGSIAVDVRKLDTGIELRNRHLRETYLETGKGAGFETATLTDLRLGAPVAGAAPALVGKRPFTAKLAVHGQVRAVAGVAEIRKEGSGYAVDATFPLPILDFGIARPSYLGIGVKDEVRVHAALRMVPGEEVKP